MLGADRVIAIDRVSERLSMASENGDAEVIDHESADVYEELMDTTDGRGPDRCVDAVGTEAHGAGARSIADRVKQGVGLEDDRPIVLRETIQSCRKRGPISIPGVYTGMADKIPIGAMKNEALTVKTGQIHVQAYLEPLLEKIEQGEITHHVGVTHEAPLDEGPEMYETFNQKEGAASRPS